MFLFAVILCIAFTSSVFAFEVQTNMETNAVCPSTTILIEEVITAEQSDSLTISLSGSAAAFATAVPPGTYIEEGQSKSVFIYLTPSTKITPGTYNLEVNIVGSSGSKTLNHIIIVENCHKTILSVIPSEDKICACEGKTFDLKLENKGSYLENYQLSVEGPAKDWVTLSGTSFSLQKDSSVTLSAQVKSPCGEKGEYQAVFKVKSDSKYAKAEATLDLEIVSCYDYSLNAKSYAELCENEKVILPITIKNLGTADNDYAINLEGPSWLALDTKNIRIDSEREATFNLIVHPPFGTDGEFNSKITVLSENGKVMKDTEIGLKVMSCYGVSLDIEKDQDLICNGLMNTYSVNIKNNGKFKNSFNLELSAPTWTSLSEKTVSLDPEETGVITLTVSPNKDIKPADYAIVVKAMDLVSGISTEDKLSLTTLSVESCYKPVMTAEKESFELPRDSTSIATFNLENKGAKSAEYVLEISGSASSFSQINPATLKLDPEKAETLYVYLAPSLDISLGTYSLTVTARLKDSTVISSKTIQIKILEETEPVEPTDNETSGDGITGGVINEEPKKNIFTIIADFFRKLFSPRTIDDLNDSNDSLVFTNNPPELIEDIPNINLAPGESEVIELSDYIIDPEGEDLFFTTIKPENVNVKIRGSMLTLTADYDFEGERELKIYSTDGEHIVQSNEILITISETFADEESVEEEAIEEESEEETTEEEEETGTAVTGEEEEEETTEEESMEEETEESEEPDITGDIIAEPEEKEENGNFFSMYRGYIIGAIVIVIIIIIIMSGAGKKILEFFEEEVPEEKTNNGK